MGCSLDDFEVSGFQRQIADDVVTVPARTKERKTEGVLFFMSAVFMGFTGDDQAALYHADRIRKLRH